MRYELWVLLAGIALSIIIVIIIQIKSGLPWGIDLKAEKDIIHRIIEGLKDEINNRGIWHKW